MEPQFSCSQAAVGFGQSVTRGDAVQAHVPRAATVAMLLGRGCKKDARGQHTSACPSVCLSRLRHTREHHIGGGQARGAQQPGAAGSLL